MSTEAAKILDSIKNKQAPGVIGKPVFERTLEKASTLFGVKSLAHMFGPKVDESKNIVALPVNLGSKTSRSVLKPTERANLLLLKKTISDLEIQASFAFKGQHATVAMLETLPVYKDHLAPLLKAYNITDFANWIPTLNTRFYFEEYDIPFLLAAIFDDYPMESSTVEVPGDLGHLEGQEETDVATFGSQSTTQSNYSVTSRNNVVHAQITQDLMSDSAPAYMEKLRRDVLKGTVRSYERAILNGSILQSATRGDAHFDLDTRALAVNACKFQKAFEGLRGKAFAADAAVGAGSFVYDHGGDTASKTMFEKLLNMMGKFASEKDDLAYILPSSVENQLVTGAIPELFTAFAFGGLASNVSGQVPPVFGVKPVTTQYAREDLGADGKAASPAAGVYTNVLLVKKSRFQNFLRQATRVWAAPSLPSSDVMLMTAKTRHSWNGNPLTASEKACVMAINVAIA